MFKRITPWLGVSVTAAQEKDELRCTIKFHEIAEVSATTPEPARRWFWDRSAPTSNGAHQQPRELLIGNTQFFGYIVVNSDLEDFRDEDFNEDDDLLHHVRSSHFITSRTRPIIGGKLGGIPHLESSEDKIPDEQLYFISDLVLPPNARDPQSEGLGRKLEDVTYKEICDAIFPFHYTPQHLLFTTLVLEGNASFDTTIPLQGIWPPSYRQAGSLFSICYTLAVSVQIGVDQYTAYFPVKVTINRVGNDPRWLQPIGFSEVYDFKEKQSYTSTSKDQFLKDLDQLVSTTTPSGHQRKRSSISFIGDDDIPQGFHSQLPSHFKTSYHLRVNNIELCEVHITRPYFHVGEDVGFRIAMDPSIDMKVLGYVVHIECQESFDNNKFVRSYPITGSFRTNTLAMALAQGDVSSGYINIPRWITQQFQLTMATVSYYLVFKFNLANAEDIAEDEIVGNDLKFRLKLVVLP